MRFQTTVILIALNAALLAALFHLEKDPASERAFTSESLLVLPPGLAAEADGLSIEGPALNAAWVLRRGPRGWHLIQPIEWPANFYAVNRMLNQLQFLEWETRFSAGEVARAGRSLADYGLEEPRAILTIQRGGEEVRLKIGQPTEAGRRLYLLSPGESQIYVVNRELLDSVTLDLEELRSSSVFDLPVFEIRSLILQISEPENLKVRLVRENGRWRFESPMRTAASQRHVAALLGDLPGVKTGGFFSPSLTEQGLDNPRLRLSLEGRGRRQTLLLGRSVAPTESPAAHYYAKLADNRAVFSVPASPFDALRQIQETLREKTFLHFDPAALTELEIAISEHSILLQKLENGQWQVMRKDEAGHLASRPADPEVMRRAIKFLQNLEAVHFLSDAPAEADLANYGFNTPQRRVTIRSKTEKTLLVGALNPQTNLLYAKVENEPPVYQVGTRLLQEVPPQALYFRRRILFEQPPSAQVRSLLLMETETYKTLLDVEAAPASGSWEPALADQPEAAREALKTLLDAMKRFPVKTYLRNSFNKTFVLDDTTVLPWKYRLAAEILLPGGDNPQIRKTELFFTERRGGSTQFGGSPAEQVIFALPQDIIDALHEISFGRQPPPDEAPPPEAPAPAPPPAE